jgi:hypothetical protein
MGSCVEMPVRTRSPITLFVLASVLAGCQVQLGSQEAARTPAEVGTETAPALVPLAVTPWGDLEVRTVCVQGTESYEDDIGKALVPSDGGIAGGIIEAFEGAAEEGVPVAVVDSGCDVTISVNATGKATGASYMGEEHTLYFATDVDGSVTMTAAGMPDLTADISEHSAPPDFVVEGADNDQPEDASFFVSDPICAAFAGWFGPLPRPGVPMESMLTAATQRLLFQVMQSWPPQGKECGGIGAPA